MFPTARTMTIAEARALVGRQIGLPASFDGSVAAYSALTPQEQLNLNQSLALFIVANPASFTPEQVGYAARASARNGAATIEDASFDWGMFFEELGNEARDTIGAPLEAVGRGVSSGVTLAGNLIPVAVLIIAAAYLLPLFRQATQTK